MSDIKQKREEIADSVFKNLYDNFENRRIVFYELPTGSGKTGIILKSAYDLMKRYDTSVIISTSSNELALKFLNEGAEDLKTHYNIDIKDSEMELLLGKSNFLDIESVEFMIKSKINLDNDFSKLDIKEVRAWYEDRGNRKLVNKFINDFNLSENDAKYISMTSERDIDELATIKNFPEFLANDSRIFITNHLYLVTLSEVLGYNKAFRKYQTVLKHLPIFLDEAHDLKKLATLKYRADFSAFRFQSLYKYLVDSIFEKDKKLSKPINKLKEDINTLFKSTICPNCDDSKYDYHLSILKDFYEEYKNTFKRIINRIELEDVKSSFYKRFVKKEFDELASCINNDRQINFNYSTKRGYLKASAIKKDVKYELRRNFWQIVGNVSLFSGTYRVNAKDLTAMKNKWAMARLGLYKYFEEDTKYKKDFNLRLLTDVSFKIHKWIFPRDNFSYTIITDDKLQYPRRKKSDEIADAKKKWSNNIANFYNFYDMDFFGNYNTLLLTGSYEDSELLAEELAKKIGKERIFYETQKESIGSLLRKYANRAFKKKGNILIGTLTCYTGINLYGDLCHCIIMTKLPYAPFNGLEVSYYKDSANITFRQAYENEMVLTFRQGIGRGSRSETDETALFLLDKRITQPKRENLKGFLDEMGGEFDFNKEFVECIGDYKEEIENV